MQNESIQKDVLNQVAGGGNESGLYNYIVSFIKENLGVERETDGPNGVIIRGEGFEIKVPYFEEAVRQAIENIHEGYQLANFEAIFVPGETVGDSRPHSKAELIARINA